MTEKLMFEQLGITVPEDNPQEPETNLVQENTPTMFEQLGIDVPDEPVPTDPVSSIPTPTVADMPEDVQEDVEFTKEQMNQIAASVFSPEELEEINSKDPIGFFEARKFLDWEDVVPAGGIKQAEEAVNLWQAAEKLKNGEEPTQYESDLMTQFIRETVEKDIRGFSVPGGIAYGGAQLPAFAIEFWATGGVGKAAQKGTMMAAQKAIKTSVLNKALGVSANVAARSLVMPSGVAPKYAERRLNNYMAVTDKGEAVWQEGDESPAMSALKAFGHTAIEVGSEMSGAAMGKYLVQPVSKAAQTYLKTPVSSGIMKLPPKLRNNLYEAYLKIKPNAKVTEVFTNMGWNGMLAELGEERVAQVLTGTFDLATDRDMTMDDYLDAITPSKEDLMIEAGIISMFGGVKGSVNAAVNIIKTKQGVSTSEAQEIAENMSELERENYISENLSVRSEGESPDVSPEGYPTEKYIEDVKPEINNDESIFQGAYRNWVDDFDSLNEVVKLAKEQGMDINSTNNVEDFARISRGVMSTIEHNLKYATTKYNPETGTFENDGKSLRQIMNDFDAITSTIEPNRDIRREDSNLYGVSMSILDDVELSKTNENIEISPEQEAQARADIAQLEAKYGDEIEFIRTNNREKTEYTRRILQNLVDSGLISQDSYNEMVDNRPNYLPLDRVFEETDNFAGIPNQSTAFTDIDTTLRMRRGSNREIQDIDKSIIKNTARILDAAARNRVGLALTQYAEVLPNKVQRVMADPKNPPKGTVTVYVDGKPQFYKVSKPLLKTLEGMTPTQLSWLEKTASTITGIVKAGATTYNPDFFVMNPIRDVVGSTIVSQGKANPVTFMRGLYHILAKTDLYKEAKAQGISFDSFMDMTNDGFVRGLRELSGESPKLTEVSRLPVFKQINDLNSLMELAPRVGVYEKLRKNGETGLASALYGRDLTLDFSRKGFKGRRANLYWAFLNAGIQGTDKLARTIKKYPVETTLYGMATVTAPSMMLTAYYMFGADEETKQRYLETPQWERDLFWLLPKEDGSFRRIPKPFSFGFLFGSMPERMAWAMLEEPTTHQSTMQFLSELATGVIGSVAPMAIDEGSVVPTAIKPAIEVFMNQNFFRDTPIYPTWLEDNDDFVKKNASTSTSMTELSEFLKYNTGIDVSPANLQHLIEGYTSSIGRNLLQASDAIVRTGQRAAGEDVPSKPITVKDYPILRAFSTREPVGSSSQSVQTFYDNFASLQKTHKTYRTLVNNGTREEANRYREENLDDIRLYKSVRDRYMKRLKMYNKQSSEVWEDTGMTSDEKVEELSDIGGLATELARDANEFIKENKENRQ